MVVNDPQGLRDYNEKLAALLFPQCCPPTLVSRDTAALKAFIATHGEAVLKPLDGLGGRSISRARAGEPNLNVILETMVHSGMATGGVRTSVVEGRSVQASVDRAGRRSLSTNKRTLKYHITNQHTHQSQQPKK